ncbi:M28 family peptidase [Crateriforma conspicua]|uniref:M28 family peptidase n=1 Tax=Crateriforma conspicua TaxID=2527996 RepID=UPI00118D1D0B|nr:M28 family peptidase [Crateriforma conspicua]QDV63131.1 Aminopeptidase YwaD precursor [Crateriforma conspicua]
MSAYQRRIVALAATLGLVITAGATRSETPSPPPAAWKEALRRDVQTLAGDAMRGRGVGTPEIDTAAKYIADRFDAAGLRTDWFDGTPFQELSVRLETRTKSPQTNHVTFRVGDDPAQTLRLDEAMRPLSIGCRSCEVKGLPLVFVGYGINAPEYGYNDYAGVDVRDKVVLILRKEPGGKEAVRLFEGPRNSRHAYFQTKIDLAIRRGAAGILIVNDPDSIEDGVDRSVRRLNAERERQQELKRQLRTLSEQAEATRQQLQISLETCEASLVRLDSEVTQAARGLLRIGEAGESEDKASTIPVISIARDVADDWIVKTTARSIEEVQSHIDQTYQPVSFELPDTKVDLSVQLTDGEAVTKNVIGVIEGKGELADQTIILGAHYDHVGMGGYGSLAPETIAVHNGADDNASGTAAMLSVATRLNQALADSTRHRRVVFIAFTGEERGLLGSKHYVRQSRFPLSDTVAMINMDMIGRLRDNELTVYGLGTSADFKPMMRRLNRDGAIVGGQQVAAPEFDLYEVDTGYGPSDHASFYEAGVPVLFFFTGLHDDYHRPGDDFEKLNLFGMSRICDLTLATVAELATTPQRPSYADTERQSGGVRRQLTVRLGVTVKPGPVVVDASGQPTSWSERLQLTDVKAGGAAALGGLRVGDRLLKIDDHEIRQLDDLYEQLRQQSPGDIVPIDVLRGGIVTRVDVRMQPR